MPKRVLLDCRVISSRMDGLGRYTTGLAMGILERPSDVELTLIVPRKLPHDHPLRVAAGTRQVDGALHFMDPWSHIGMRSTFARCQADVYHYPHFNMPISAPRRSVVTVHDLIPLLFREYFRTWPLLKRAYFRLAAAASMRRARRVIVPSIATREDVARLFPFAREKTRVIYEGVDSELLVRPSDGVLERCRRDHDVTRPFLLYVGVSRPHKNLEGLLRALSKVRDQLPHELLVVGQGIGAPERLRRRADELGVSDRVRWIGYLAQPDLRCLYALADALVLCSFHEGFGLPVLEAMASGLPTVVSQDTAPAEIAADAAVHVDPASPSSIAQGLVRVCGDDALRRELRARGRARAETFTWRRMAEETLDVYDETLRTS